MHNDDDEGPPAVGQYVVKQWSMVAGIVPGSGNGITVTLQLNRNIFSIFTITYLPIILMNGINQASNYIAIVANCELIMTINITSMMVIASIYISVSSSLPTTSAVKPVEVWLLINLVFPFMVIMINIMLQVLSM